jgi:hypothetical protein
LTKSILRERPEPRYCAFLDILGFKEILKTIETQPTSLMTDRLISALNFMSEEVNEPAYSADLPVYEETPEGVVARELGDPRLTYVSDCVIISTEHTPDGLKALCRKVSKIWLDLAWDGFFCRGAISEGLLFHHRDIVFGTGYLNAYNLENKAAYPRVIFDPHIVELVGGFPQKFPLCPPTAHRGDDGYVYLRYFPYRFFPPYASDWTTFLLRVREHISKCLASTTGPVLAKYIFLKDEFNFCVHRYRGMLEHGLQPIATGTPD